MSEEPEITPEKAAFVESKTQQLYDYALENFDLARKEGNNILQWLFAAISGGIALIGGAVIHGYICFAFGVLAAIAAASIAAAKLVGNLRFRHILPRGNYARHINPLLGHSIAYVRWAEATGMDERIDQNISQAKELSQAIDDTRKKFLWLPFWLVVGTGVAYALKLAARWILSCSN